MSTEAGQILDQVTPPQAPATNLGGANKDVQPPPANKPGEEPISSKLSVLMEREKQALNRERMAKVQEEKLRDQLARIQEFESIKSDPKKAMEALGLTYDQLTQTILKDGEIPPSVEIQRLREELEQYKAQNKQEKDLEAENRKKMQGEAESRAISDFKSEITTYLKDNSARYELIDFEEAGELVFDVIDEFYNRTIDPSTGIGQVMPMAEAADKVEGHLEKKYLAAKEKSKVKAFWGAVPKQVQQQLEKKQEKLSQPPQTLTNNLSQKISTKPGRLPEEMRIQKILEDFRASRGA